MLDVRRLRVLREVAARGSFSTAAEALSFTQSAVSQQIAALARESGSKLIERSPRGIRLADAEEELAAIAGLRGGRLRIATFQSAGATLVPRALGEFHRRHPDVELTVTQEELNAHGVLLSGEADIAIIMDFPDSPALFPELELTWLLDDPYDAVLPADHPLAGDDSIDLSRMADERFIVHPVGMGCREGTIEACRAVGFEPKVAIECDENEQIQAFVATGLGIAIYPRLALATVRPGVVVKPLRRGAMTRRVWAATVAGAYRSPAAEAMLEMLQEVAAD